MRRALILGLTCFCLAAKLPARGVIREFVLDPARSRVHVTAGLLNDAGGADDGTPQAPGSDASGFQGLLRVELTGNTLQFIGGSFAEPQSNPLPFVPGPGGAGASPADFAWVGPATPGGPAPRAAALRNLLL